MNLSRAKYITFLISYVLVTGAGVGLLLHYIFPDFMPLGYWQILLFFFLVEIGVIYSIDICSKKLNQRKLVNAYMMIKVIKMTLSLLFILIYSFVVKTGIKNFAVIFVLFYFLFLLFDTYYFAYTEKQLKKKNQDS